MLIEESELRLGLVGLGPLTEYAALTLFADAQAHALVAGTGRTLRDVVDVAGTPLYPDYFWTHLVVPPERPLERHQIWDRVAVGVEVTAWGPTLESSYLLGTPTELALPAGERPPLVALRSASMWFADQRTGEPMPARPKAGTLAELPKLAAAPAAMATFRDVRVRGAIAGAPDGRLALAAPVELPLVAGRDGAPGHSLLFAQFSRIMDLGERALLLEHVRPPIHAALADHLSLVEREVYYIDNCAPGARVHVDARGRVEPCEQQAVAGSDTVAVALLRLALAVHDSSGRLLALANVTKRLVVPRSRASLVHDAERFCRQHGGGIV